MWNDCSFEESGQYSTLAPPSFQCRNPSSAHCREITNKRHIPLVFWQNWYTRHGHLKQLLHECDTYILHTTNIPSSLKGTNPEVMSFA